MVESPVFKRLSVEETSECERFYSDLRAKVGSDAGWARVEISNLPDAFPEGLLAKCGNEAVVVFSDVSAGRLLCVNARRWDDPADSVDQHPIAVYIEDEKNARRVIVEHGTWDGRITSAVSSDYGTDGCLLPGISDCMVVSSLPDKQMGRIEDILDHSDRQASRAAWDYLSRDYMDWR